MKKKRTRAVAKEGPSSESLREIPEVSQGIIKNFIGGTQAERPDDCRRASPITYVNAGALQVQNSGALGNSGIAAVVASGASMQLLGSGYTVIDQENINIHFAPEMMAGAYANFANVSHSDYEFTITFARVDHEVEDEEIPGVVVSRVNLSPKFMRELIDAMEDNYSKWQTREGIKNLPEFDGPEDQTGA